MAEELSANVIMLRGSVKFRGYSRSFPTQGMPTLLLSLRALLGISSRCELLCLLASRDEFTPPASPVKPGISPELPKAPWQIWPAPEW